MDGKNKGTGNVQAQKTPGAEGKAETPPKTIEMIIAEEQEKIKKAINDLGKTAEKTLGLVKNCQIPKLRDRELCDLLEKVIWKIKAYYK